VQDRGWLGTQSPSVKSVESEKEYRAQSDVVLTNVGGGKEGSGSVLSMSIIFFFFSFFFFFLLSKAFV